jgi:hypothetical protein
MPIERKVTGFGDEIERVAKKLGLDKVADKAAKMVGAEDCGCGQRRDNLNDPNLLINKVFYKNKGEDEQK